MKYVFSELKLYISNRVVSKFPSAHIRRWFYRSIMGFEIGENSYVFMDCFFDCRKQLIVGKNTAINRNCRLDNRGTITIGDNVSISNDTIILTADHDMDSNMIRRKRPVVIEDYVWIGTRAMIMPGVTIRRGAVVAAGAVVTKDVGENTVVGGVPAKILKVRENPQFNYSASYKRLFQ